MSVRIIMKVPTVSRTWRFVAVAAASLALLTLPGSPGLAAAQGAPDVLVALGEDTRAEFKISPDGSTVVYLAKVSSDNFETTEERPPAELYSVPIDGGTPTRLSAPFLVNGDVARFEISADSSTVVYVADQETSTVSEIYSVPIGGGAPTKLNGPMVAGGDVHIIFRIAADSSTVVFAADAEKNGTREVFAAPLNGGSVTKLSRNLVDGGRLIAENYYISPDSTRVIYVADALLEDVAELFSVAIDGGPSTRLSGQMVNGGDVKVGPLISSDSATVVYRADQDTDGVFELYSVPLAGGVPTKLNPTMVAGGDINGVEYAISPDSRTVVYVADAVTDGLVELFSVPVGGGLPKNLSGSITPEDIRGSFLISPDSRVVVYESTGGTDLYSVMIDGGGTARKLNDRAVTGRADWSLLPDSSRVVYLATGQSKGTTEVRSVPSGGGDDALLATVVGTLPRYDISPDSSLVVLYDGGSVTAVSAGGAVPADRSVLPGGGDVRVSPDSRRVVFVDGDRILVAGLAPRCNGLLSTIVGTGGSDTLIGTEGADVIVGLGGDDTILGLGGADTICGGGGNDVLRGGRGPDTLLGGPGDDLVFGNRGRDVLKGRSGDDELFGGLSNDTLAGGRGDDRIRGYKGRDNIDGGPGTDNCRGGPHKDSIVQCER